MVFIIFENKTEVFRQTDDTFKFKQHITMKKTTFLLVLFLLMLFSCNDIRNKSLSKLQTAKKYYENNKYDSSLTSLNDAIRLDSSNSEAYYYLSKTNFKIDNYNEALKYLNLAEKLQFNSDSIEALKLRILFEMEKYDDYIESCDRLISKNSSNYKMYLNKATALFNKANDATSETRVELLKDALKNVNISLKLNKEDNKTFVLRGAIRYALADNVGAIGDFDMAISQEKKDSSVISIAYRYKGLTEEGLNNLSYAESLLDSAILFAKKNAVLYINRGDIRISLNKTDMACKDYRKALEFGDNDAIDRIRENCK